MQWPGSACLLWMFIHACSTMHSQVDFGAWYASELRLILTSTDLTGVCPLLLPRRCDTGVLLAALEIAAAESCAA